MFDVLPPKFSPIPARVIAGIFLLLAGATRPARFTAHMKKLFDSIEAVVADLRKGKMVIVVDDADRENEGDLIMAAEKVTPTAVNFMAKHGRGLICVPTSGERLNQLGVEEMVVKNRESFKTDFQVSVDAARASPPGSVRRIARGRSR